MFKIHGKLIFIPLLIITIFLLLIFVTPVHADDGQPVDDTGATVEVVETPAAEPVDVSDPVSEELPADVPAAGTEAAAEPVPDDTAVGEDVTLADAVETLSEGGIEVVDAGEDAVVTRDSADVVLDGDPYFTVGSTTYYFMHPGGCGVLTNCSESTSPIQDALDYMAANSLVPSDRKLYITADTYDEDVDIDGTLNGVKGLTGLIGTDSADDTSIVGDLYIHDMPAGFTVANLSVYNPYYQDDAAIWAWDNKGTLTFQDVNVQATETDSSGIIIENHTGSVVLNRVTANNNAYKGADIMVSGTVLVMNSTFDGNLLNVDNGVYYEMEPVYAGLNIVEYSTSPVTINGISAQWNRGDGMDVYAPSSTVNVKNSDFSHSDESDEIGGWGDGLWIIGNTVVLEDIYSNNNNMRGIFASAKASFTGTRLFTVGNGWAGVRVDTCDEWGDGICHNPGAGTVTIKGSPSISNGGVGYDIFAKGAVVIYDIFSGFNGEDGVYIDNSLAASAPITLTKLSITGNGGDGLEMYTRGFIKATNVTSNENSYQGIYIEAYGTGAVTFTIVTTDPNTFNETARNGGNGYTIYSNGPVTLTSLDCYENGGDYGGYIYNASAASAAAVKINTLDPKSSVSGYFSNAGTGLVIFSRGAITISDVIMDSNQRNGAYIDNSHPTDVAAVPVTISNSRFYNNCLHDEFGCYWSGDPDQYGLIVLSRGLITLSNIISQNNYGVGVYLDNTDSTAGAGVVIKASADQYNQFLWNASYGLEVHTNGPITTTNLTAVGNGSTGVSLNNNAPGKTGAVNVNVTSGMVNSFLENNGAGLEIYSNGSVSVTNIIARNNYDGFGLFIQNDTGTGSVTIKQSGGFSDYYGYYCNGNCLNENASGGLYVESAGTVTVNFHRVQDNNGTGITVIATAGKGAVTLNGISWDYNENVRSNAGNGVVILANGNITLKYVYSRYNDGLGADLENNSGTGLVTINYGYFDENVEGIYVNSSGAVTWKEGSANNNRFIGALFINANPLLSGKPVTLTNIGASNNGESGLQIISKGVVLLTNVEANNNSANYYELEMGDDWTDNMSPNQIWSFTAPGSGTVSIYIESDNFTPSMEIYDSNWNFLFDASGIEGEVGLMMFEILDPGETYYIHVLSDQWEGWAYEIQIYEGTSAPGSFNYYNSEAYGIFIDNSAGTNAAVTIKNTAYHAWTSNNSLCNVLITSNGLVTLYNMDLNDSGSTGLNVNNSTSTGTPGVVITNVNFYNNDQSGAFIRTKGPVTVKNGEASGNNGPLYSQGLHILNNLGPTALPVTITDFNAYNNGGDGIYIESNGAVTFTGVRAGQNGSYGAQIYTPGAFTVNKPSSGSYNYFNGNTEGGLMVVAGGKVTLTRIRIYGNGDWNEFGPTNSANGISLVVENLLGTSPVVITDVYTDGNSGAGTEIYTYGAVTVTRFEGNNNNSGNGLYVYQTDSPSSAFAIVLSQITTNNNAGSGIWVEARGNITINKFDASNNGMDGLHLDNTFGTGSVTITNPSGGYVSNQAGMNGSAGVNIASNGTINLTGIEAYGNGTVGVVVNNNSSTTGAAVTLNGIISRENGATGISANSTGVVTINNSWSTGNHQAGIYLETPANVFMTNTASINNWWAGIYADLAPSGNLKLTNCTWFGNLRNDPFPSDTNLMFDGGSLIIL